MQISLSNLAALDKIQKNIWTKVRLVGLLLKHECKGITQHAAIYENGL